MSQALKAVEVTRAELSTQLQVGAAREAQLQQQVHLLSKQLQEAAAARRIDQRGRDAELLLQGAHEELRSKEVAAEHMKSVIATMRKDSAFHHARISELENEVKSLQTQNSALEARADQMGAEGAAATQELRTADTRVHTLISERDETHRQNKTLESKVFRR
jgi:chromosome segregation ATPase